MSPAGGTFRTRGVIEMHPFRAFLFSFAAGLAVLFSGHGVYSTVLA
jgi:hypothetical protein